MTHLLPIYRPDYGKDDRPFIHLEGEFEFPADMHAMDVYMTLRDRAELIGGLVRLSKEDQTVRVFPWNGPGSFLMHYDDPAAPFTNIEVLDRDGEVEENYTMEHMKKHGEAAQVGVEYLNEHMKPADEDSQSEPNWAEGEPTRYRIDYEEGDLIPIDEDEDNE